MAKIYDLQLEKNRLNFANSAKGQNELEAEYPSQGSHGVQIVCRMGDPGLMSCTVLKKDHTEGALFIMRDKNGLLYSAIAYDDLVYSIALGFFGQITANARYGVDVFENLELPDD